MVQTIALIPILKHLPEGLHSSGNGSSRDSLLQEVETVANIVRCDPKVCHMEPIWSKARYMHPRELE